MKKDIILSGVGGQGILSIATVIGQAALKSGLYMKQAEVHGMSQRGGDVQSNLRISDQPIASDLIPTGKCDIILSLEPMEALRYLPYLNSEGWLITNETPFINIPNYPSEESIKAELDKLPHKIVLNVNGVEKQLVPPGAPNTVRRGPPFPSLDNEKKKEKKSPREISKRRGKNLAPRNQKARKVEKKKEKKKIKPPTTKNRHE